MSHYDNWLLEGSEGSDDYEGERCEFCESPLNDDLICESCTEEFPLLKVAGLAEVERLVRR